MLCVWQHTWGCRCTCQHAWKPEQDIRSPLLLSVLLPWGRVCHWAWSLPFGLDLLASQLSRSVCPYPAMLGHKRAVRPGFLCDFWVFKHRSSYRRASALTRWGTPPGLCIVTCVSICNPQTPVWYVFTVTHEKSSRPAENLLSPDSNTHYFLMLYCK